MKKRTGYASIPTGEASKWGFEKREFQWVTILKETKIPAQGGKTNSIYSVRTKDGRIYTTKDLYT